MRFRPMIQALAAMAFAAALFAGPLSAAPQDPGPYDTSDQNYSKARIVRVSFVDGDVQISRPEDQGWERALVNMPVQQGYAIATGRGRAEIEFESGATVRLSDGTQVQFNEMYLRDGDRITRMTLSQGSAIFYANLAKNDIFTVVTPGVEVNIPRNSRFRMDVTEKHVNVAVLKGNVAVDTQAGNYKLSKGQALLVDTRAESAIVARAADPDEFDRWAADRDDAINSGSVASANYVSAPFRYGMGDLSRYGSWVYAAPYGYVWQPWGIYAGWSPYYDGRWVFVSGYGWSWVSYEPWGWLPYHYGSWAYLRAGWAWVPGPLYRHHWSPGLVVWINLGGGRYGWCPRSPFDRPGRIYYNTQVHNTVIVNTSVGIIGGGRNERLDRPHDLRFVNDGGPRDRNFFGDVGRVRGRVTAADGENGGRGRATGRSEEFGKPGAVQRGGIGGTGRPDAGPTPERGFAGRTDTTGRRFGDEAGRPTERGEELRGKPERNGEQPLTPRNDDQLRPRTFGGANVERNRSRPGDPNTSVEYDPQSRRFENQPARPPMDRNDDRSRDRRDSDVQPRSYPRNDGSNDRSGSFGGQRPSNVEPRGRGTEPRPETRPEPRYDRNDSGSRGGFGGSRGDSPRPSPPPAAPPSSGGFGGRPSTPPPAPRVEPPRPSPRPSSGGGSNWVRPSGPSGGGGSNWSRPSGSSRPSSESRPSSPRGGGGHGRPH